MEFKEILMQDVDEKYKSMKDGTTAAPFFDAIFYVVGA